MAAKASSKRSRGLRGGSVQFQRRDGFVAYPEDLYLETEEGQQHYDPRVHLPWVERDVLGILKHGVIEDVIVEKQGDRAIVVDGRSRVIACMEANRRLEAKGLPRIRVPVAAKRGKPDWLFEIAVICNEHRKPDDPITQALKIERYMGMGRTDEEAAELWGVCTKTIDNRLKLLSLCPEAQKAVVNGTLKVSRALKLAKLSFLNQRKELNRKPSPRAVRRPTRKKVQQLLATNGALPASVRAAIQWANGEIDDEQAKSQIKGFEKALQALEEKT